MAAGLLGGLGTRGGGRPPPGLVSEGVEDQLLGVDVNARVAAAVQDILQRADVVDGDVEEVDLGQLVALLLAGPRAPRGQGDGVLQPVVRHVDLPHPHPLARVRSLPPVLGHLARVARPGRRASGPALPAQPVLGLQRALLGAAPQSVGGLVPALLARGGGGGGGGGAGDGVPPVDLQNVRHVSGLVSSPRARPRPTEQLSARCGRHTALGSQPPSRRAQPGAAPCSRVSAVSPV